MKCVIKTVFLCVSALILFSCGTTSEINKSEIVEVQEEIPEVQDPSPVIDDWEYRGFGKELEEWVVPVYKILDSEEKSEKMIMNFDTDSDVIENVSKESVQQIFEGQDFQEKRCRVYRNYGINSDMCEAKVNESVAADVLPENEKLILLRKCWIRLQDEEYSQNPYCAIRIYLIQDSDSEKLMENTAE